MFTFEGKHFHDDWGMRVRNIHRTMGPPIESIHEKIPGRRGVSDQGIEEGALEIKIEFTYRGEDRTDIRNHYRQLWAWLRNRGQLGELIFDEEPDKSYYARVIGMTELEEFIHISKGELTFFIPDPDALGKVSEKRIAGLGIGHVDSTREDFMKGILTNLTTERINGDDDLVLEKYGPLFLDNAEWDDGTYEDMMKTSEELTLYRGTGAHKSISATEEWNDSEQSENTIGVSGNLVLDNIPEYFMQDDMSAYRTQGWNDSLYERTRKGTITQQPGYMRLDKTGTGFDSTVMVYKNRGIQAEDRTVLIHVRTTSSEIRFQFVDNGQLWNVYLPNTGNVWTWFRVDYADLTTATLYELGNNTPIVTVQGVSTPAVDRFAFIIGDAELGRIDVSAVYYGRTSTFPDPSVSSLSGYSRYRIPLSEVGTPGESSIIFNWARKTDIENDPQSVDVRVRYIRSDQSVGDWIGVESGQEIPEIQEEGPFEEGDFLEVEVQLSTTDLGYSPEVMDLNVSINSSYVSEGSWKKTYDQIKYITRAVRSKITFEANIPSDTSLEVLATWIIDGTRYGPFTCTSGHHIPFLTTNLDLTKAELEIKIQAATNDPNKSPKISLLQLEIEPGYKIDVNGERIAPGIDISSIEDYGSSRIWWESILPDPAKTTIRVYVGFSAEGPWTEVNNGDPIPGIGEEGNEVLFTRVVLLTTDPTLTPRLQVIGWEISQETDTDLINEGTAPADAIFYGTFQNSADYFQILHIQSGRRIMLEYPFEVGDEIEIDCERGRVAINGSARDGQTAMSFSSRWIEVHPGYNSFEVLPAGVGEFFCKWRERWL